MANIINFIQLGSASYFLSIFCLFIGLNIIIFLLYKRNKDSKSLQKVKLELKQKDDLIAFQKKEIDEHKGNLQVKEDENQELIREIQHRVKNNLQTITSLLSLQSANVDDMIALKTLTESQSRVQSLAIIHQSLYRKGKNIGIEFENYTQELFTNLANLFNLELNNAKLNYNGDNFTFDLDTSIPLSLIVNELMTNTFKYAYAIKDGSINISLKEIDGTLQLTYFDDGISVSQNRHIKNFGSKLINLLCKQLGGTMEIIETSSGIVLYEFEFTNYDTAPQQTLSFEREFPLLNQVHNSETQTHMRARSGSL